jgi:hypothetical protein
MAWPFKYFALAMFFGVFCCCCWFAKQMVDADNAPKGQEKRHSSKRGGKKQR